MIQKAERTKEFKAMNDYFGTLPKEDYELLDKGTHPNPKKTKVFDHFMRDMATYVKLKSAKEYLEAIRDKQIEPTSHPIEQQYRPLSQT
jgi:hypothetical protein